ncbi:MAG: 4Fe-4S binding protein [Clostridia bacterium]|nr:4Fe-4S binding protein [Clostridia bacterium]
MLKIMSFASHALSNLFHKPVTRNYPFVERKYPERTRGHIDINVDDCLFCGICAKKCPSDAITVDRASKTWSIDRMGCVQCENCVNSCPKSCLTMANTYSAPDTKAIVDTFQGKVEETSNAGGKIVFSAEGCVYCGLCAKKCPANAITVDRASKTWTINEEECAKCGACVAACPKKCLSQESGEAAKATAGGEVKNDLDVCVFCGLCARKCPQEAITVDRASKTWTINKDECVSCGACVDGCPKKCLTME